MPAVHAPRGPRLQEIRPPYQYCCQRKSGDYADIHLSFCGQPIDVSVGIEAVAPTCANGDCRKGRPGLLSRLRDFLRSAAYLFVDISGHGNVFDG